MNVQNRNSLEQVISSQEMHELKKKTHVNILTSIIIVAALFLFAAMQSLDYVAVKELEKAGIEASKNLSTIHSLQKNEQKFLKNILFQIASQSELQQFIMDRNDLSKELILDKWVRVEEQLSWIYQIRLLANSGYEVLRVDYDRQSGFAENINIKQNKKNRDYFKKAIALKKNELYISKIELNREYNEVSYPLTPVIRFATPIFQPSGQSAGILVVNFFADNFIAIINNIASSSKGKTLLLDPAGNYLQGFDETQNWAHELISPDSENFNHHYPEAWKQITQGNSGNLLIDGQRFVFQSLDYVGTGDNLNRYYALQHITDNDVADAYNEHSFKIILLILSLLVIAVLSIWFYFKNKLAKEIEHNTLELISKLFYSKEAIVITDCNWKISVVNTAFCDATGYDSDSVAGKFSNEFYRFEDQNIESAMIDSVQQGKDWFGEVQSLHRDGTLKTNLLLASSVMGQQGKATHYVMQMIDISDRKEMENELKIAAAAFETRSAITITDKSGNIIKVNKAFTDITGYTQEDVVGKNPKVLSSGKHDQAFYENLWNSITNDGFWQGEIWNKHKNGKIYPEWITISSIKNEADEVIHYVATFEDITLRKSLEAEIEKLSKKS